MPIYLRYMLCLCLLVVFAGCATTRDKDKEGPNKDETVGQNLTTPGSSK